MAYWSSTQRTGVAKSAWHCRVKFPSQPYIRKSLKTASEQVAVSKAEKLYDDLRYRHERGLALRSPPLPQAIDEYLAWLEDEVEHGDAKPKKLTDHRKLSRYVREFFENTHIDQITEAEIDRYRDWRRSYWTRGPGAKRTYIEYERNGKLIRSPTQAPVLLNSAGASFLSVGSCQSDTARCCPLLTSGNLMFAAFCSVSNARECWQFGVSSARAPVSSVRLIVGARRL